MVEYPVNLDDAPKMEHSISKRIDKEIGIMRARAARNVFVGDVGEWVGIEPVQL